MTGRDPAGARHSWLNTLTGALSRIIAGRHADTLLGGELPARGAVIDLPDWLWSVPVIDTGRKAAGDGGPLLLPVRVEHSPGPVLLVADGANVDVLWRANGLGVDRAGILTARCGTPPAGGTPPTGEDGFDPDRTLPVAAPMPRRRLRAALSAMVRDGRTAQWQVLADLEPFVRSAVRTAHASLSLELCAGRIRLDDTELQTVTDRLVLGVPGSADSPLIRLLDRLVTPGRVTNVDLLHHIRRTLRRDAADTLLQHVADPRIGAAVRRFARETGISDPDRLLAEFRRAHPRTRLGQDRLLRSLSTPLRLTHATPTGHPGLDGRVSADICGNPTAGWDPR